MTADAITRRRGAALALLVVLLVGVVLLIVRGGDGDRTTAATGDTRVSTLVDPDGDGILARGPGELLRDRVALGPVGKLGRILTTFGQITDAHVRDEESPALVGYLDRLGGPFTSTFRPQETLTTQVLAAGVAALNAARPDVVVETGDLIDNNQANELDWAVGVLSGGTVRPDSGARGYAGQQRATNPDPSYYRPDVDPPQVPGLLADAQRPFRSLGLDAPWYAVNGNHDLLVSGEIASTPRLQAVAQGDRVLVAPPDGLQIPRDETGLLNGVDSLLANGLPGTTIRRQRDPHRAQLSAAEVNARLRATGHARGAGPLLNYTFDLGPRVRGIVLDTVRRDRGSGGLVDAETLAFLRAELVAAGPRWVIVFSHQRLSTDADGEAALALLDASPRVLATVAGHSHRNTISSRRRGGGPGFWQIVTASLVDFPQQVRMLRVREASGGGAVLETWMLDTAPSKLADEARALAHLDAQGGRPARGRGGRGDRNVRLWRRAP